MKSGIIAFLLFIGINFISNAQSTSVDLCKLYGSVYVTEKPSEAHFKVFVETAESMANIIVYKTDAKLYADNAGLWHFTDVKAFADFIIYFEEKKGNANFSIAYTDVQSFAACK